ncbi:thermonuclease family protein [Pseudovibrio sp. Tun.PSC04-5.I4]|uniref:thermonuclease family protein n=1 Tax=Pseudovibrio sp. Tun.PSC04-5.I4 TaxID=1798213 RepID=UPI0008909032|nr:thermonuclease family protein [Pseudovibrio sp. Tun.PSC04-5.I4]SDR01486.1 nuclease homologue [Pseudovibrio sp. Tun.PSC04-5.I4]
MGTLTLILILAGALWLFRYRKGYGQANKTRQKDRCESAEQRPDKPVLHGSAYVVDGDGLTIQKTQVRLFGVDAPEMNHPYGKKAKWALVSLCKGQKIRAEILEKDAHGRTVARCTLEDGRDLSAEMVKLGLAIDWPKFSGGEYSSFELPGVRKKLWLANARQKGHMHVWEKYEEKQKSRAAKVE